jgi:hypothetical protein
MLIMKTSSSLRIIGAVIVATLLAAAQARAIVAYDFTGVVGNEVPVNAGPFILANVFTVNSAINVTAVGAFNNSGSLAVTVPVAIYSYNGAIWNQVSGTFASFPGGSQYSQNGALFQTLGTPVTLNPGIYAIVAANYGYNYALNYDASVSGPKPGFNTGSGLITLGSSWQGGANSFGYFAANSLGPTVTPNFWGSYGDGISPSFGGATFDFTPVPEAAAFGAAAVGLLGLVYIGRFARLRRNIKLA